MSLLLGISKLSAGYLTMFSQLILDVCSLALDTFSSSNRGDTKGDKSTDVLGVMQQGRLGRTSNDASVILQEKFRTKERSCLLAGVTFLPPPALELGSPFLKPVRSGGKEVPHPI